MCGQEQAGALGEEQGYRDGEAVPFAESRTGAGRPRPGLSLKK